MDSSGHYLEIPAWIFIKAELLMYFIAIPRTEGENDTSPSGRRRRPGASSPEHSAVGFRSVSIRLFKPITIIYC